MILKQFKAQQYISYYDNNIFVNVERCGRYIHGQWVTQYKLAVSDDSVTWQTLLMFHLSGKNIARLLQI